MPGTDLTRSHPTFHTERLQHLHYACRCALPLAALVSGAWIPFFVLIQNWHLVAIESTLFAFLTLSWQVGRHWNMSLGMLLAQVACLLFIFYFSIYFDVPSEEVPRVSHLYLLIIALAGYGNFQRDRSQMQLAIIFLSLAGFAVFSSTSMSFDFALPLPDSVRSITAWIHVSFLAALLCVGVILLQEGMTVDSKLRRELRSAIPRQQFELFFQPQVNREGRLIGAEALIRWKHPKRGYIQPGHFIPTAERAGLMADLGNWVIENAVKTLADWTTHESTRDLVIAVNISADHFLKQDFVSRLIDTLNAHHVSPSRLKLELTESVFVTEVDELIGKMKVLQHHGISIALDDFGTGYSSLSYLRRLPLQQLKIDRSFVRAIAEGSRGASLVTRISQMGQDLGLEMLAEGIENDEQFQFMLSCGCQSFQGYYFGRPVALETFEERIRGLINPAHH